jgi:tetratricopeptide (TPR) repeat protein
MSVQQFDGTITVSRELRVDIAGAGGAQPGSRRERTPVTRQFETLTDDSPTVVHPLKQGVETFDTFDEARKHFAVQLAALESLPPSVELADLYNTIGQILIEEGLPNEAIRYLERSLDINLALSGDKLDPIVADDLSGLGWAWLEIGFYRLEDGNEPAAAEALGQAIQHFETALEVRTALDPWDPSIADSLLDLSDAYYALGDGTTSVKYSQAAVDFLTEIIEIDVDDWEAALQIGDEKLVYAIAFDIVDNLDLLAEAHETLGNDQAVTEYKSLAAEIEREL